MSGKCGNESLICSLMLLYMCVWSQD